MRILSVEIEGFGPFRDSQSVDFSAFDDAGIFLIGGRTGAGKSTILDAICFALYNSVPRYDGYSGAVRVRSDHCGIDDPTRVTLTFESGGERYRIVRSPEFTRPKTRGAGTTTEPARVELSRLGADGLWQGLETKIVEVTKRIGEIVRLDKDQFLQVMLLAQNRFQEFLEADSRERQALLRTLFSTQRFEDYAKDLQARAQALGDELRSLSGDGERVVAELASVLDASLPGDEADPVSWADGLLAQTAQQLEFAESAEAQALQAARAAADTLRDVEQLALRQRTRADARARLAELEARAEAYRHAKQRHQAAERAAAVQRSLEAADQAEAVSSRARAEEADARAAAGEPATDDLDTLVRELSQRIGALARAVESEAALARLRAAAETAAAALTAHDESTAAIASERAAIHRRRAELDEDEPAAILAAGRLDAAVERIAVLEAAHAAATRLSAIERRLEQLTAAEVEALRARTVATREDERLRTLQLQGRAAVLAGSLLSGEPCPVCGALEHPQPARPSDDQVTDQQVDVARAELERARLAVDQAAKAVRAAEAEAAELRGTAGGRSTEAIAVELETARAGLRAAREAQTALAEIGRQRAAAAEALAALDLQEQTAAARRTELVRQAALATSAADEAAQLVERSRGGYESVAAHVAALSRQLRALERLAVAQNAAASARRDAESAQAALIAHLAECDFPDRAAAQAAALPEEERLRLNRALRKHEDALTQSRAVLDQDELRNLPEEPADIAGARQRAAEADLARSHGTERRVMLEGRLSRAQELAQTLSTQHRRSVELADAFELLDGLASATRGDAPNQLGIPLESFVLAAELEEIVAAANGRLRTMSQGRYAIEHSDERTRGGKRTGLEILVYDAHTGVSRSPRSLSGGEKFLASLALALGLAEVVTGRAGGIQLDTLFIDEGFGSLDDETLEVAMRTLDELRQGGRTVGLISHVEAMKDQIPAQLLVEVADGGWSVIDQAFGAGITVRRLTQDSREGSRSNASWQSSLLPRAAA